MRQREEANKRKSSQEGEEFGALVGAYVEHLRGRGLSAATERTRRQGLRPFGAYLQRLSVEDARQVTKSEIDAYVTEQRRRGDLSAHTVEVRVGSVKGLYRYLVETNRMLLSPAEHVRERNLQGLVGRTITTKQATRLLRAVNTSVPMGVRDRAILEVLYATGVRREEAVKLTVFDVDLAGGQLRVTAGKGGVERVVPLGTQAQKWLGAYLKEVRPRLVRHVNGREDRAALWLADDGAPLLGPGLAKMVAGTGKKAGVRVSCHTLRRTMATELLRNGASIREVAALLGHARLGTTQRYTKVVVGDLKAAHDRHHPRGGKR